MTTLDDRRQRAHEAAQDVCAPLAPTPLVLDAIEAAIETATRVRVTPEAVHAVSRAVNRLGANHGYDAGLAAALRELGFEVEA